jgi:diketogulonate reductase-like aldo/keto reductase
MAAVRKLATMNEHVTSYRLAQTICRGSPLAWTIRQDGVMSIPRASSTAHVRENHGAIGITLTPHDLEELDRAFPPPRGPRPLEMI